ncbi:MAG: S16 family serine protease [Bacillota bacterium]
MGVTGALSPTGDVTPIGMIKEKMIIADQKNLPYMIIPEQNASEANNVRRNHQLSVEIFPVSHIDQAIQVINTLNNKE